MDAVSQPLLRTHLKRSSENARLYIFAIFIFFVGFGFWDFWRENLPTEQQVGVEKEGSNLPGCKVVTGAYIEHYKGFLSKEVHLAQKACEGRDIERGARFTVFGSTIRMADRIGDISPNGDVIAWPDGQKWTRLTTTTTTTPIDPPSQTIPVAVPPSSTAGPPPASTYKPDGKTWCANIDGNYREYDAEGKLTTKFVNYNQKVSSCTGTVMKKLNLPVKFEIKENIISMDWNGSLLEGEINPKEKTILWSNGYRHVSNSDFGTGDISGVLKSFSPV